MIANISPSALRHLFISIALAATAFASLSSIGAAAGSIATPAEQNSAPVLAYYYIWYTPDSWNRAKIDLPLLGAYSSDDESVMRQQIQWAKTAGIDGFIVSWKNTEVLSRRLDQLVRIAQEESFKLSINYESLDFSRNPLSIDQVKSDFGYFANTYAANPVFDLFGKPVIIWSGTWKFDRSQIESVTHPYLNQLQILASEKQADSYDAIADLVDGNAYYWSSVDPSTYPDYPGKLQRMSDVVHAHAGLWIAPAAPGFDARHLGGQKQVDRGDGITLNTQFNAALSSHPDAVGLISWNEFSENSHIEPSCMYGDAYLTQLAHLLGGTPPNVTIPCDQAALASAHAGTMAGAPLATPDLMENAPRSSTFDWDSSAPDGRSSAGSRTGTIMLLAPLATFMILSIFVVVWRSLRSPGPQSNAELDLNPPPDQSPESKDR